LVAIKDGDVFFVQVKRVDKKKDEESVFRKITENFGMPPGNYKRMLVTYVKQTRDYVTRMIRG
jgi:hypothetical protein